MTKVLANKYVRDLLLAKNINLLKKYVNKRTKLTVSCNICSYIWYPRWDDLRRGHGCPNCSNKAPKTTRYVRRLIYNKNGKCISGKYRTKKSRFKIKCLLCHHIWSPTWDSIQQGKWCPNCNGFSKNKLASQTKLASIIQEIFPKYIVKQNYRNFSWLRGNGSNYMELDIFVHNELRTFTLAVEYDGEQHFVPIRFGGISLNRAKQELIKTKKRDKIKTERIINSKDIKYFVRFNYKDRLTYNDVKNKLKNSKII